MRLCVVSSKECWQEDGRWLSTGGFPYQMQAICSMFDEATMVVIEGKPRGSGTPLPQNATVRPVRKPAGTDGLRKLSVALRGPEYVGRIAREILRADAVHVPLPGDIPLLGLVTALGLGKPLIARYGGSWQASAATTTFNRVTRSLMRLGARGRNVMLACGEGDEAPARGVHWLFGTAVSEAELQTIQPNLDRGLSNPAQLVYAGRLSEEKGVPLLVEMMARLKKRGFGPMPRLTILGDGPLMGEMLRLRKQLRCEKLIDLPGYVDRPRLTEYFLKADMSVQPSYTESMCKAWVDALAHGLPVIASDVGSARVTIGRYMERGWIAPVGDVEGLTDVVERALTERLDWPGLRRRCRRYAESRTLERWRLAIADRCAESWGCELVEGRLTA